MGEGGETVSDWTGRKGFWKRAFCSKHESMIQLLAEALLKCLSTTVYD